MKIKNKKVYFNLLLIVLLLLFIFEIINFSTEKQCQTDLTLLESKLKSDFDIISSQKENIEEKI